jgi:hypothetical protein
MRGTASFVAWELLFAPWRLCAMLWGSRKNERLGIGEGTVFLLDWPSECLGERRRTHSCAPFAGAGLDSVLLPRVPTARTVRLRCPFPGFSISDCATPSRGWLLQSHSASVISHRKDSQR